MFFWGKGFVPLQSFTPFLRVGIPTYLNMSRQPDELSRSVLIPSTSAGLDSSLVWGFWPTKGAREQTKKNTTSNFMLFLWWGWGCFFVALKFWWPKHVSFFWGVVIVINGCLCWKRSGSPEGCCNPHPCTYIADGNITHLFCRAFWAQDLQREGWPGVGDKESNENTRLLLS